MRTGLTPAEALRTILEATPVLGAETVAARDALGRVLVEPVASTRQLPPADNSAMDGYAVRAQDLVGASRASPVELELAFEVAAGATAERALGPGEAARILTGAPLPPGSDTVVRQEDCEREGDRVAVRISPRPREHVREAGEDVREGQEVLAVGTVFEMCHVIRAEEPRVILRQRRFTIRPRQFPRV